MLWTPTHARIHTLLKKTGMLPLNTSVLMAVSGGQDSLCLAKLLLDLRSKWHWRLAMVHCDHGWRSDSADNAAHVSTVADQWQIPCFVETAQGLAKTEAAARNWRYGVFTRLATAHDYYRVVTGQTVTDRAETVLYNLLRGSGADGIQSLSWQRPLSLDHADIMVARPLLQLTRQETGAFCQELSLPIWHDSSNDDLHYRRNRIRHELMPYLRSHFTPQVETTLAQTAEILTAEVAYLETQADRLYDEVTEYIKNCWQIRRPPFKSAPLALQRRVARRLLQVALPQPPNFEHIEKLVALVDAPNRAQTDPFPGGLIAWVEHARITLQ